MGTSSNLKIISLCLLFISVFFWIWALKNTLGMSNGNWDFGLVSFLTVAMTSSYLMGLANSGVLPQSWLTKTLVIGSHMLVAANYLIGTFIGFFVLKRTGFAIYCLIFTFLWIGISCFVSTLMMSKSSYAGLSPDEQIP